MARGRITVVESVYHQTENEQPTMVPESRYSRPCITDEQPFLRKGKIGEQWQSLETGWLPQTSLLRLSNEAGKFSRIPSLEEREQEAAKVIEVAFVPPVDHTPKRDMHSPQQTGPHPCLEIHPGESSRFRPCDLGTIRVRCRSGEAPYHLSLLPL
jgi:hypothetical protein